MRALLLVATIGGLLLGLGQPAAVQAGERSDGYYDYDGDHDSHRHWPYGYNRGWGDDWYRYHRPNYRSYGYYRPYYPFYRYYRPDPYYGHHQPYYGYYNRPNPYYGYYQPYFGYYYRWGSDR